jgi:hypothetical protein
MPVEQSLVAPLVSADGRTVIGRVEGVNDATATTRFEATITQHEAQVLYEHWYRKLSRVYDFWAMGQVGSSDMRIQPYAIRRLDELEGLVGEQFLAKARGWVDEDVGRRGEWAGTWRDPGPSPVEGEPPVSESPGCDPGGPDRQARRPVRPGTPRLPGPGNPHGLRMIGAP